MAFENRYSALDRLLHTLAFSTRQAQLGLADLENLLFRQQLARYEVLRPLFITALPRAGTTLLLELCVASGEFASHTYRHMPFILLPMLWNRFSKRFRRSDAPRERAHGDGLMVSVESPEAFEEMVWLAFWPKHYQRDRILPWREEEDNFFRDFLSQHVKKIVALSAGEEGLTEATTAARRYVSKNNLNIARVPWLTRTFRDSFVLILFRDPLQHCASLLRQHLNFLEIHRRDPFAKRYMEGIGHFDFGANLRPVDFDGWCERSMYRDPQEMNFWLEYWCATYHSLSETAAERVGFINFDAFCAAPELALDRLAHVIEVSHRDTFLAQGVRIHAPSPHAIEEKALDATLVEKAKALHRRLARQAIV